MGSAMGGMIGMGGMGPMAAMDAGEDSMSKNMAGGANGSGLGESGRPEMYRRRARSSVAGHGAQRGGGAGKKGTEDQDAREVRNQRAMEVLARVKEKLTGRDFKNDEGFRVEVQVDKLIREATNLENLCQHYIGWCSFW
jgi:hypothetical protein